MSRRRTKRWEVETWVHRASGEQLWVCYDASAREFWTRVGPEEITAATQVEVKRAADKAADRYLVDESKWRRIILVAARAQFVHRGSIVGHFRVEIESSPLVGLDYTRLWVRESDGKRFTRDWLRHDAPEFPGGWESRAEVQRAFADIRQLTSYTLSENEHELPYSEELWARLGELKERIRRLGRDLETFVARADLEERLLSSALPGLLPSGEES